ncbi:MAG: hypothetical protein GY806_07275 [Gammaproteobacteria bacterium]|nr:hypothetical protein [Gammaproteobacteria bacterium]
MILKLVVFLSLITICNSTIAEDLHLIVSGTALHIGSNNLNEKNYGLGFEYDFEERNDWIRFLTGVSFKDSNDQTSKYFGIGTKRRFRLGSDSLHIDTGALAFIMTRKDSRNNMPFLAALPFASIGNDWMTVNFTYVPKVSPKMYAFWYFQAAFRIF